MSENDKKLRDETLKDLTSAIELAWEEEANPNSLAYAVLLAIENREVRNLRISGLWA